MKTFKIILTVLSLFLIYSFADAQCQGDKIKVYKGANGCSCHCMRECVTPAELPVYLANGWNTTGCFNCCDWKWFVDAGTPKTSLDEVTPNAEPGSITVAFTLAKETDVRIQVKDMSGRCVATIADEYREDLNNELIWDNRTLSPGIYYLTLEADGHQETKMISVTN